MSAEPSKQSWSTNQLLATARQGSRQAIGKALESCRTYLTLIAKEELDHELKAKIGASDLVQETFVAAHQVFDRFAGDTSEELLAWLRGILLNKISEAHRFHRAQRRTVKREIPLNGGPLSARLRWEKPTKSKTASRQMAAREDAERISLALSTLSPDHQEVIRLRNWKVMSFEEIGKQLNRTPGAARSLWIRALEQLAKALELSNE